MILDLDNFIQNERPFWDELNQMVLRLERSNKTPLSLVEAKRFHYLYQRASSDLVKLQTFAGEVEASQFLENLVGRTYNRLHGKRSRAIRFQPWDWLTRVLPNTFQRHIGAFWVSLGCFLFGALFGAGVMVVAPEKKMIFLGGFTHLAGTPSERVAKEEADDFDGFEGRGQFSSQLMTHNTRVCIRTMVMGIFLGVVTIWLLINNGAILGIVIYDYIADGQGVFLTGWLLPHGSVEIPAIILGGQCGLMIAHAVFGWGTNVGIAQRFRAIRGDLLTMVGFIALLLIWAGVIESFLSQYHKPELYPYKIAFGAIQLGLLCVYLWFVGRKYRKRKGTTQRGRAKTAL